jgi:hypothetical protein
MDRIYSKDGEEGLSSVTALCGHQPSHVLHCLPSSFAVPHLNLPFHITCRHFRQSVCVQQGAPKPASRTWNSRLCCGLSRLCGGSDRDCAVFILICNLLCFVARNSGNTKSLSPFRIYLGALSWCPVGHLQSCNFVTCVPDKQ